MKKTIATCAAAITALAFVGSLRAHHSSSMFDLATPIWIKGTIVGYQPMNPHSMFTLEETIEDGQSRQWTVEGPSLPGLGRMGLDEDFLKVGDVIEVCGFAPTAQVLARYASQPISGRRRPPIVHGHVVFVPAGRPQIWGSYGKLENCVRPGDETQTWLDYVNTDATGRRVWCFGRASGVPSVAPKALVEAIDRRMTEPCR